MVPSEKCQSFRRVSQSMRMGLRRAVEAVVFQRRGWKPGEGVGEGGLKLRSKAQKNRLSQEPSVRYQRKDQVYVGFTVVIFSIFELPAKPGSGVCETCSWAYSPAVLSICFVSLVTVAPFYSSVLRYLEFLMHDA